MNATNVFDADFVEKFSEGRWDPDHARKLALRLRAAVQHAHRVLDNTPIGEVVTFEGGCPSGSTYTGGEIWDGTDECRQKIARQAYSLGNFTSSYALLCRAKDVRGGAVRGGDANRLTQAKSPALPQAGGFLLPEILRLTIDRCYDSINPMITTSVGPSNSLFLTG